MRRFLLTTMLVMPVTLYAQQDDRGYLTALLEDNLSGGTRKVTITGFAGALSSQATIESLTIADSDGIWLTLKEVSLDWNRAALLTGHVSVNTLTAQEIVLERQPLPDPNALPSPEASGFALPDLPVSVEIGKIAAERIVLGAPILGEPVEASLEAALTLSGGDGSASLTLLRNDDGPKAQVTLQASYVKDAANLAIDFAAHEDAGGLAARLLKLPDTPSVDLTIKGTGPLSDYTADIALKTDGQSRLAGDVTLASAGDAGQRFSADLGGDLAPLFLPEYAAFFGNDLRLQTKGLRAQNGGLDLESFALQTRAMTLQGALTLAADGLPERFKVTGELGLNGAPVVLPLTSAQPTSVTRADIALSFDATSGQGWSGDITIADLQRADFAMEAARIIGSGRINRSVGSNGVATVGGTLRFDASGLAPQDAALSKALGQSINGSTIFSWQQGGDGLGLPRLTLNGEGYALQGGARIEGLSSALAVTGHAKATVDDIGRLSDLAGRKLSGAVQADLTGNAALLAGSFDLTASIAGKDLTLDQAEADNLLHGASMIDLSIRRDETGTRLRQLDVTAQSLKIAAQGTLTSAASEITADLSFADLAVLGAQYKGALQGKARFIGNAESGNATLDAKADGLAIGIAEVDALLAGQSTIALDAGLTGAVVDLRKLQINAASLVADVTGRVDTVAGHDLKAALRFPDLRALGNGYGGALQADARFTGTPETGALQITALGDNLSTGQVEVNTLLRGQTRLAADLNLSDGRIKINTASLQNPQLNADASGSISDSSREVQLSARLANLALLLPDFPGPVTVSGRAVDTGNSYQLDLTGQGPGQIDASVKGQLAGNLRSGDLAIKGSAQAGLANVFIKPRAVSGPVRFDLRLNGPLAPASLAGRISLSGGRISAADIPFALERVNATADLARGQMQVQGDLGISTGGTVSVGGTVGLAAPFNAALAAKLTQVVVKDPTLFETRLNGTVTVDGALAGGARIGGDILLNETEVQVPSTGFSGASGIEDLLHVNETAAVRSTRIRAGLLMMDAGNGGAAQMRPYPLALTIRAPSRLFIRGRGLDAELGGMLTLGGTTANVVPSGAFELVRGRLEILGKRLDLTEATLQLQGDFTPYLRIVASTVSDGITSSVMIEGDADAPKVTFTSQPELPEEEVLSRVLFGQDLTSLSAFQAVQLASAVATLAGRGGEGLISKLRKGTGLDDLDLVTNSAGETSVKAGKYISRNVYTEVIVGQDGTSEINLNLDLTDTVTLRGSTGTDGATGIGIFKEKDY